LFFFNDRLLFITHKIGMHNYDKIVDYDSNENLGYKC